MTTETQPPSIRTGIVNDYAIIVEGIRAIFAARPDLFDIVYASSLDSGVDEVAVLDSLDLDLVLLDPFATRVPLRERVPRKSAGGRPKYVILSWYRTAASVAQALDLGFAGYRSKTLDADSLIAATVDIHHGRVDSSAASGWPAPAASGGWPGSEHGLTARESEMLCWIAQGLSNKEIAERAYIGAESLKSHIRSAYRKIGVTTRSQAIVWCVSHGMIAI